MSIEPWSVPHRLAAVAGLVMMVMLALPATAVFAQQGLDVSVRSAEVQEDGQTRVVVDVDGVPPGDLDAGSFEVAEADESVGEVQVGLAGQVANPDQRAVILALDVSESTEGAARQNAIEASEAFAATVTEQGVEVGLVTFGAEAELVVPPTTSAQEIVDGLASEAAGDATRLYDAVVISAEQLEQFTGQRSIVLFTDGTDNGSEASLAEATQAAAVVGASVTSVALQTTEQDTEPLEVMAEATEGSVIEVENADGLGEAFAGVAADVNSQYILTYPATGRTGQFPVSVTVTANDSSAIDEIQVLNTISAPASVAPNVAQVSSPGLFADPRVSVVAIVVAGLATALILWSLLVPVSDRQVVRNLEAAVGSGTGEATHREDLSPTTAAMSRRAIELIERVPKPEGYDEAMQQRIDRAAWPLRSSEFTTLRVVLVLVVFGLTWALLDTVLFAFLFAAIAWIIPNVILGFRVSARQNKFMEQLPDTLQLLSGSLKAGYGVLQAIDTVVRETQEPTKSEFQRVLSEARLGLPLEQSLEDMAERIGTDDFRWVAVSISIQRRVGGNLAQLLETVAATLRERAATRRQIKALSAEGRLSAVILTALPFALGLYMFLVNPDYLSTLITTGIGQVMIVGAVILMVIGIIWMKNLVEIDV